MYVRKGLPEKDDFVICTIKEANPSSVFVKLEEYENVEGMIHVSEIARKQVRAMKVYLKPGTQLVCKVMSVDPDKKFVELSLRRVGEGQRRAKLQEWENEKIASNILDTFVKQNKIPSKENKELVEELLKQYNYLYAAFLTIAQIGADALKKIKINPNYKALFVEFIQKRITLPKQEISGYLHIQTLAPDGVDRIKKACETTLHFAEQNNVELKLSYISAPKYKFVIKSTKKEILENFLNKMLAKIQEEIGRDGKVEIIK
ncbi:MAG: S1 RNA-binding domain-containing protein [Candidatus Nanoarchaeia archaeon]